MRQENTLTGVSSLSYIERMVALVLQALFNEKWVLFYMASI